jgi:hypothetical protein
VPDPRPPHLLYVAWGFPPSRTGGVHRALATVNAFAGDGWRVTVLTVGRAVFEEVTGSDPRLEQLVDERVEVRRLPFSWPAQRTDLRAWPLWRVLFPRLWATVRKRRDLRHFPEVGYGPWRVELERAALAVHAAEPVDLVIATTNPEVSVTAGLKLHQAAGVPYVVDYRDAWSLHTYSGRRRHAPDSPVGRWEARSLGGAAEVWLVNEPLRRWHAGAYPALAAKLQVVMNGYDRDLPAGLLRVAAPGTPLRFGYLGTMTHVVPLAEFVAGWRRGRETSTEVASGQALLRGYLGYYATPDAGLAAIVDGGCPHLEVLHVSECPGLAAVDVAALRAKCGGVKCGGFTPASRPPMTTSRRLRRRKSGDRLATAGPTGSTTGQIGPPEKYSAQLRPATVLFANRY